MSLLSERYNLKFEKRSDASFNDSINAAIDGTGPCDYSRVVLAWKEGKRDRASYDFILVVDASNVVGSANSIPIRAAAYRAVGSYSSALAVLSYGNRILRRGAAGVCFRVE